MLIQTIEAILLAAAKPVKRTQLQKQLGVSDEVFTEAIEAVRTRFSGEMSGIHLLDHDGSLSFITHPDVAEPVRTFLKQDAAGELSRPSLETLTIIAYRGPVTKPEIEQIRGVNCTVILRNLLIRGLIREQRDVNRLQDVYTLSADCMGSLGITSLEGLPDYQALHSNEQIDALLSQMSEEAEV